MSPYGALSGIAVEDSQVWAFARKLRDAQHQYFGRQLIGSDGRYLAAEYLLGEQVYDEGAQLFDGASRPAHHQSDVTHTPSGGAPLNEPAARSSQAKIGYCDFALGLAKDFSTLAFAMVFSTQSISVQLDTQLRKDYAYLFERFYNFLSTTKVRSTGVLVLPRVARGRTFVSQQSIVDYFTKTTNGRLRSQLILPDPLYADGDLGVILHLVEILSYISRWSVRLQGMVEPGRSEMDFLATRCLDLRYSYKTDNGKKDWSFKFIEDFQPFTKTPSFKRPNFVKRS